MTTYQYLNSDNTIVAIIDADGISRSSGLASVVPEGAEILPYVAPPTPIPQTVTRRQAKQALLIGGKLSLVQPAIDAIPEATQRGLIQIEWDDSQEFQRNRASVIAIGTAIGLDSEGIDDLFVLAATL